jgi:hypothetical protein
VNHDNLGKQTRAQLLLLARQHKLKGVSRLRKAELITRLLALSPPSLPSTPQVQHKRRRRITPRPATVSLPPPLSPIAQQQPQALITQPQALTTQPEPATRPQAPRSRFLLHPKDEPPPPPPPDLPVAYNDNRLMLLARDPHWLYAYWDFSAKRISSTLAQLAASEAWPVLRLHSVTSTDHNGRVVWNNSIDITLTPFATNWHIPVPHSDSSYYVEIGYLSHAGRFAALGRSDIATTPPAHISSDTTLTWQTPPERQPSQAQSLLHPPLPLPTFIADLGSSPK